MLAIPWGAAMARRVRVGPASSPKALGVVAVAVLVVALVVTGRFLNPSSGRRPAGPTSVRSATVSSQAPSRIGGKAGCPPAWPVLAMSNHASYPAGHPALPPPGATPVACYQTAAQAAGAGYAPARLPAGAVEVRGVYLTPPSRRFRASCQRAADRLGFAVPCPGLLPTTAPGTAPRELCEASATCRRGQLLAFSHDRFVVPFGYVGAPGGSGALMILAMPARGTTDGRGLRCRGERRIATPMVHRIRAVLAACPDDPASVLGGAVLVRWSERGAVVEVTTLGSGAVNQLLVIALADRVHLVEPRR
jgi:stage V sporulation protein SpoVS